MEKNSSRSQNLDKDVNFVPEGAASDVTHDDDLVQGFTAPRTKCIMCRRKHKPGCIGHFCSNCPPKKV